MVAFSPMKISVYNRQKDLKVSAVAIKNTVRHALEFHKTPCDEIAVHLITDRAMRKMHADFFDDPTPTDCISFPYDKDSSSGYFFLGEVFICPKTAFHYIAEQGSGDPYNEVTLYLIHGILHLLGYDDMNTKDRKIMRSKEKELMIDLTKANLVLSS